MKLTHLVQGRYIRDRYFKKIAMKHFCFDYSSLNGGILPRNYYKYWEMDRSRTNKKKLKKIIVNKYFIVLKILYILEDFFIFQELITSQYNFKITSQKV